MLPVVTNMLPRRRQRQMLARFFVSALVASPPLLYMSLLRRPPAALAADTAFWFLMSNCIVGALFFGSSSSSKADSHPGCCHDTSYESSYLSYYVVSGTGQPAVASCLEEANTMTSSSSFIVEDDGAWPFLEIIHASALQRAEEHEVAIHPSTDKNHSVVLKGQGTDELEMVEADRALLPGGPAEPEPEPGLLVEEEIPEAWARAQRHSRTPDHLQHGKAGSGEGKLRRSATEGSKPAAAEEGDEYWEMISDEELNRRVEEFIARFKREMRRQTEQEAGTQESDDISYSSST